MAPRRLALPALSSISATMTDVFASSCKLVISSKIIAHRARSAREDDSRGPPARRATAGSPFAPAPTAHHLMGVPCALHRLTHTRVRVGQLKPDMTLQQTLPSICQDLRIFCCSGDQTSDGRGAIPSSAFLRGRFGLLLDAVVLRRLLVGAGQHSSMKMFLLCR